MHRLASSRSQHRVSRWKTYWPGLPGPSQCIPQPAQGSCSSASCPGAAPTEARSAPESVHTWRAASLLAPCPDSDQCGGRHCQPGCQCIPGGECCHLVGRPCTHLRGSKTSSRVGPAIAGLCPCAHLEGSETGPVSAGARSSPDPASKRGIHARGWGGRETSTEVQPRVLSPGRAPYLDRVSCQKPTCLSTFRSSRWSPAPTPYRVETALEQRSPSSDCSCSNFRPPE